ncbi:MAG TPA: hypothetical protein PKD91_06380 [Bacteroidia bacterium]|nr:hypothetical protein [Bacteroidia bacterium]
MKAEAEEKARLEAEAKAKAEAEEKARVAAALQAKIDADNARKAEEAARLAAIESSKQQALKEAEEKRRKEIEAQKEAYAKANTAVKDTSQQSKSNTTALPTVDKDYPEGISEETLNESNRKIYRTVIKKATTQEVFSKVVYNWGGVFYFKGSTSVTESNYTIELKRMKDLLNQK